MAIIAVDHLTKEFRLGQMRSLATGLRNMGARLRGLEPMTRAPFRALDDVSFSIEPGEVVGLIGHNGAGKSTLLKLLSRVTEPTSGSVRVRGRISPLIEVTGGFIADLTGRENIYLAGTILGMSRPEIRRKFDEIVAFAELERFIDTPLKRYSSGMYIRLGFSLATSVDAEILLIDEVLAVGDVSFQRKCMERMEEIISSKEKTLLVVGHNIRQIERICTRAIMLERGKVAMDGSTPEVCAGFLDAMQRKTNAERLSRLTQGGAEFTTFDVEVSRIEAQALNNDSTPSSHANSGELSVRIELEAREPIPDAEIVVGVQTADLLFVTEASSAAQGLRPTLAMGANSIAFLLPELPLHPGVYCVALAIYDRLGRCLWRGNNLSPFEVTRPSRAAAGVSVRGLIDLPGQWTIETAPPVETQGAVETASADSSGGST